MATCTSQLVEFVGSEVQSSGPCHIIFLIKLGPNNPNFDPTFRGRYEVQKNKWTPHCQTEFDGESGKNDRFVPRELLF
jgi:hypothetical protein